MLIHTYAKQYIMKKIVLLLLFTFICSATFAQNKGNVTFSNGVKGFNKQEFRQCMQEFITKEAGLTDKEAEVFFPIYNEYKDKQRQCHIAINKLKHKAPTSGNEQAYEECLMMIAKQNAEMAGLDSVYYKKICKVISAEKLFKILSIEDRMHRRMLQNYNRKRHSKR